MHHALWRVAELLQCTQPGHLGARLPRPRLRGVACMWLLGGVACPQARPFGCGCAVAHCACCRANTPWGSPVRAPVPHHGAPHVLFLPFSASLVVAAGRGVIAGPCIRCAPSGPASAWPRCVFPRCSPPVRVRHLWCGYPEALPAPLRVRACVVERCCWAAKAPPAARPAPSTPRTKSPAAQGEAAPGWSVWPLRPLSRAGGSKGPRAVMPGIICGVQLHCEVGAGASLNVRRVPCQGCEGGGSCRPQLLQVGAQAAGAGRPTAAAVPLPGPSRGTPGRRDRPAPVTAHRWWVHGCLSVCVLFKGVWWGPMPPVACAALRAWRARVPARSVFGVRGYTPPGVCGRAAAPAAAGRGTTGGY